MMEQITAPSVVTALSIDGHAPLSKRNGLRTMIPLTWLGWEALVEYLTSDGEGVSTSATILYCRGLGIICTIAGAPLIVAWDAIRIVELRETDIPRLCTICHHEGRFDIDTFLVDRSRSYRDLARQFGVSKDAVSRHVSEGHISKLLTLAADAQRAAQADTLLDRIEALQRRVEAFLSRVEETDN